MIPVRTTAGTEIHELDMLAVTPGYSAMGLLQSRVLIGVWLQTDEQALLTFCDAISRLVGRRTDGCCLIHGHAGTRPPGDLARSPLMDAMRRANGKLTKFQVAYEGGGFASAANRAVATTVRTITGFPIGFGADIDASDIAIAKASQLPHELIRKSREYIHAQAAPPA